MPNRILNITGSGNVEIENLEDIVFSLDFSKAGFSVIHDGCIIARIAIDSNDNTVRFSFTNPNTVGVTGFIRHGGEDGTVSIRSEYWIGVHTRTFLFGLVKVPDPIHAVKVVKGAVYDANRLTITGLSAKVASSNVDSLLDAADSHLNRTEDSIQISPSTGSPVVFLTKWFDADSDQDDVCTLCGTFDREWLLLVRRCLLGFTPADVDEAGGIPIVKGAARAATEMKLYEVAKGLLVLLPPMYLAACMESPPFLCEEHLAEMHAVVLRGIGLELPVGASVETPSLSSIVAAMTGLVEEVDEANITAKRARASAVTANLTILDDIGAVEEALAAEAND